MPLEAIGVFMIDMIDCIIDEGSGAEYYGVSSYIKTKEGY